MAKVFRLFDEERTVNSGENPSSPLPLITTAKKKASKNDTPLEKEIRRFNRLVKQLYMFEEEAARQKQYNERYEQLYQQQLLPELAKLAQARYRFAFRAHQLFQQGKF